MSLPPVKAAAFLSIVFFADASFPVFPLMSATAQLRRTTRQFAQCYLILAHFQHSKFNPIYTDKYIAQPVKHGNASLFLCVHGCAAACVSCATKQTFAQCTIFLQGTLFLTFICYWCCTAGQTRFILIVTQN